VDDLIAQLAHVEHFRGLPASDLRATIGLGQIRQLPAGAVLFEEGQPGSGLFVLLSGRAHLGKLGPSGEHAILTTIEPVIMFNEVAGLDRGVNRVTAEATQIWQIGADGLHALLLTHPPLALGPCTRSAAATVLCSRMSRTCRFARSPDGPHGCCSNSAVRASSRSIAAATRMPTWRRASQRRQTP